MASDFGSPGTGSEHRRNDAQDAALNGCFCLPLYCPTDIHAVKPHPLRCIHSQAPHSSARLGWGKHQALHPLQPDLSLRGRRCPAYSSGTTTARAAIKQHAIRPFQKARRDWLSCGFPSCSSRAGR
jgi:hypothetical protein